MANLLAMGDVWLEVPRTLCFELRGALREGCSAKDVMLSLLGRIGCTGASGGACAGAAGRAGRDPFGFLAGAKRPQTTPRAIPITSTMSI